MLLVLIVVGLVLYFVLRGKGDKPQVAGAPKRAMGQGPIEPVKFVCPYPKCGSCGAEGNGMKQEWDGMRAVKWTCGSCGTIAGVQSLKDEELPPSARRALGLDQPPMMQQGQGYSQNYPGQQGGGVGSLLTGMMIGSMMGGDHHHHHDSDGWNSNASDSSNSGWSDGGNESWGDGGSSDSGGGSDWGDSGGGDSGGDW
jgi:hypothetical protein